MFGPVCLGRTLWWWEHGAEQASPHGGPGCAEKGKKEVASHNILPKTHPFPPAGLQTLKTPTCGKHFQFNYSHPPLLGALSLTFTQPSRGAAPALAITDTTHCPASDTDRSKASVPRDAEARALVAPSLCYLPQTQALPSKAGALSQRLGRKKSWALPCSPPFSLPEESSSSSPSIAKTNGGHAAGFIKYE